MSKELKSCPNCTSTLGPYIDTIGATRMDYSGEIKRVRQVICTTCGFTNGRFGWRKGPTDATIQPVVEYGDPVAGLPAAVTVKPFQERVQPWDQPGKGSNK